MEVCAEKTWTSYSITRTHTHTNTKKISVTSQAAGFKREINEAANHGVFLRGGGGRWHFRAPLVLLALAVVPALLLLLQNGLHDALALEGAVGGTGAMPFI